MFKWTCTVTCSKYRVLCNFTGFRTLSRTCTQDLLVNTHLSELKKEKRSEKRVHSVAECETNPRRNTSLSYIEMLSRFNSFALNRRNNFIYFIRKFLLIIVTFFFIDDFLMIVPPAFNRLFETHKRVSIRWSLQLALQAPVVLLVVIHDTLIVPFLSIRLPHYHYEFLWMGTIVSNMPHAVCNWGQE